MPTLNMESGSDGSAPAPAPAAATAAAQPGKRKPAGPGSIQIMKPPKSADRPASADASASMPASSTSQPVSSAAQPAAQPAASTAGSSGPKTPQRLDDLLVHALTVPKDRTLMLKLDKELERFMRDASASRLEFPPMSSYQRLIVHRVADYFMLNHTVVDKPGGKRGVVLVKTPSSRVPRVRFEQLVSKQAPRRGHRVKILTRNEDREAQERARIEAHKKNADALRRSEEEDERSLEEREEEYARARARIFEEEKAQRARDGPVPMLPKVSTTVDEERRNAHHVSSVFQRGIPAGYYGPRGAVRASPADAYGGVRPAYHSMPALYGEGAEAHRHAYYAQPHVMPYGDPARTPLPSPYYAAAAGRGASAHEYAQWYGMGAMPAMPPSAAQHAPPLDPAYRHSPVRGPAGAGAPQSIFAAGPYAPGGGAQVPLSTAHAAHDAPPRAEQPEKGAVPPNVAHGPRSGASAPDVRAGGTAAVPDGYAQPPGAAPRGYPRVAAPEYWPQYAGSGGAQPASMPAAGAGAPFNGEQRAPPSCARQTAGESSEREAGQAVDCAP